MTDIDQIRAELTSLAGGINEALQLAGASGRAIMDFQDAAQTVASESVRPEAGELSGLIAAGSDSIGDAIHVLSAAQQIVLGMAASA